MWRKVQAAYLPVMFSGSRVVTLCIYRVGQLTSAARELYGCICLIIFRTSFNTRYFHKCIRLGIDGLWWWNVRVCLNLVRLMRSTSRYSKLPYGIGNFESLIHFMLVRMSYNGSRKSKWMIVLFQMHYYEYMF